MEPVIVKRPSPLSLRRARLVLVTVGAAVVLGACTQSTPGSAVKPKVSAVVPEGSSTTVAGAAAGATTTAAIDSKIKTLDDVRATLTADGVLDFDQADCIVTTLRGAMPDKDIITTFATADLTKVATDKSAAVVKAFGTCVPKESIMKPLAQGVQETAKAKGVAVSDAEVDCMAKQLAATVTYEDLLLVPEGGEGGLSDAAASKAVQSCLSAEAFAALGIGG